MKVPRAGFSVYLCECIPRLESRHRAMRLWWVPSLFYIFLIVNDINTCVSGCSCQYLCKVGGVLARPQSSIRPGLISWKASSCGDSFLIMVETSFRAAPGFSRVFQPSGRNQETWFPHLISFHFNKRDDVNTPLCRCLPCIWIWIAFLFLWWYFPHSCMVNVFFEQALFSRRSRLAQTRLVFSDLFSGFWLQGSWLQTLH